MARPAKGTLIPIGSAAYIVEVLTTPGLEQETWNEIILNDELLNAVANSPTAMNAVAASSTAMNAVANSSTAMDAVAASQTAMDAVAVRPTALSILLNSTHAEAALINSPLTRIGTNNPDLYGKFLLLRTLSSGDRAYVETLDGKNWGDLVYEFCSFHHQNDYQLAGEVGRYSGYGTVEFYYIPIG